MFGLFSVCLEANMLYLWIRLEATMLYLCVPAHTQLTISSYVRASGKQHGSMCLDLVKVILCVILLTYLKSAGRTRASSCVSCVSSKARAPRAPHLSKPRTHMDACAHLQVTTVERICQHVGCTVVPTFGSPHQGVPVACRLHRHPSHIGPSL
jgi:hypothetical protein